MVQAIKFKLGNRDPLDIRIDELELSVRSENALKNEGVETLRELVTKPEYELLRIPNFGRKSLEEVEAALAEFGLRLNSSADPKVETPAFDDLAGEMADALLNARAAREVYAKAVAKVQSIAKQLIHVSLEEDL